MTIDPANATPTSRTFYTIASERNDAAHQTAAGGFAATIGLTNKPTIAVGAPAQSFEVTFTVAGGTIPTAAVASLAVNQSGAGSTPGTVSVVQGARSSTSITFIVTVNAPTGATATVDGFTLTAVLADDAVEGDITLAATTNVLAGGVSSLIDTVSATTLVRYASAVGTLSVTSNNAIAALPDFKLFSAGAAPAATITNGGVALAGGATTGRSAEVASNYTLTASTTNNAGGDFKTSLASATPITAAGIINGATITIVGGLSTTLTAELVGVTGANITSTTPNSSGVVIVLNDAGADEVLAGGADLRINQTATTASQVAIPAGTYTTSITPTAITGYSVAAVTGLASGAVTLDGVNFIAPWISGNQAAGQSVIRLSNGASTATGNVTLRLNSARARAAGVTTGSGDPIANQTCATNFQVPANGELQIGSAELTACFGNFLRGDVQITIQSASTALTAKARTISNGVTTETSLGRFSGSAAAGAAF